MATLPFSKCFIIFCINIFVLEFATSQADIDCYNEYECMNQTLNGNIVAIRGYKGAIGSTSTIGTSLSCYGTFSCAMMNIVASKSTFIFCHGAHSCSNITFISNSQRIECTGSNSCMFADITSTDNTGLEQLLCEGYGGCAYSHIDSIGNIEADGAWSLYKAVIDTQNTSNSSSVNISLSGDYSGYDATIICREHQQCNIYCDGRTSCYRLFIDCIGDCMIYNRSEYTILPITNITQKQLQTRSNFVVFEFGALALMNDEECNIASMSLTFDSYDPWRPDNITVTDDNPDDGPICCRAEYGCGYVNHGVGYKYAAQGNIICSGRYSCSEAWYLVSNYGTIFCESSYSCSYNNIYTSFIYCMGYASCPYNYIYGSRLVLAAGRSALLGTEIWSSGNDLSVYLTGAYSGWNADIYCEETDLCEIICVGYSSCTGTTLSCNGICTVECNDDSGCPLGWNATDLETTVTPKTFTTNVYTSALSTQSASTDTQKDGKVEDMVTTVDFIHTDGSKPHQSDHTLAVVLISSSVSLLIVIGAIIWYWTQRRKQQNIFEQSVDTVANTVPDNDVQQKEKSIEILYDDNKSVIDDESDSEKLYDVVTTASAGKIDNDNQSVIEETIGGDMKNVMDKYNAKENIKPEGNANDGDSDSEKLYQKVVDDAKPTTHGTMICNEKMICTEEGVEDITSDKTMYDV